QVSPLHTVLLHRSRARAYRARVRASIIGQTFVSSLHGGSFPRFSDIGEGRGENLHRLVDLLGCRRKGGHEANHRAAPSYAEDQPCLQTGALNCRAGPVRRRAVLVDQLDTLEDASPAQVADKRVTGAKLLEPGA